MLDCIELETAFGKQETKCLGKITHHNSQKFNCKRTNERTKFQLKLGFLFSPLLSIFDAENERIMFIVHKYQIVLDANFSYGHDSCLIDMNFLNSQFGILCCTVQHCAFVQSMLNSHVQLMLIMCGSGIVLLLAKKG